MYLQLTPLEIAQSKIEKLEAKIAAVESSSVPACSTAGFNYVDVVGKGCEGWLNLFFGDHCIALVNNLCLADEIRKAVKPRSR